MDVDVERASEEYCAGESWTLFASLYASSEVPAARTRPQNGASRM
jgi:hypothetical protein